VTEQIVYAQQISVPYRYSAGFAQQAFLRGLQERRILGSRAQDGRVLVPPRMHDELGARTEDGLVEVAASGALQSWTEVVRDGERRVYGLIRLDGADTELLHMIDAPADVLAPGLRVVARWADAPEPEITAIVAFAPE
jgi:uncharacterized OB-fold protein